MISEKYFESKDAYKNIIAGLKADNKVIYEILDVSARLYRYSFTEQAVISCYKPAATACASYNDWKNKMNCQVLRGSHAIPLFQNDGSVKYVFDQSDVTPIIKNGKPIGAKPRLWEYNPEMEKDIITFLTAGSEKMSGLKDINSVIFAIAESTASLNVFDFKDEKPLSEVDDKLLKNYCRSVFYYMVMKRIDNDFDISKDAHYDDMDFSILNYIDEEEIEIISSYVTHDAGVLLHDIGRMLLNPDKLNERLQMHMKTLSLLSATVSQSKDKSENNADNIIYEIYQMKQANQYKFMSYKYYADNNIQINMNDYENVFSGNFSEINGNDVYEKLNVIFEKFNVDRPEDFKGHALSVSDVITIIKPDNTKEAYFVDYVNFKKITGFYDEKDKSEVIDADYEKSFNENNVQALGLPAAEAELHKEEYYKDEEDTQNEIENITEPVIKCEWSESNVFEDGRIYSIADFDYLMKNADTEWIEKRKFEIEKYGDDIDRIHEAYRQGEIEGVHLGYAKTRFTVYMPDGRSITARQDIGDGDGGVIDFLRQFYDYKDIAEELEKYKSDNFGDVYEKTVDEAFEGSIPEETGIADSSKGQLSDIVSQSEQETEADYAENFHFQDNDNNYFTAKERFWNNIDAIKTLKKIEEQSRYATFEEQEILSGYVGWGGLSDAFDNKRTSWKEEFAALQSVLTENEYEAARSSVLTAYYTPLNVITSVYEKIISMGITQGNILEPSCGTGRFIGSIPKEYEDKFNVTGIELDSITARIASNLFPQSEIINKGFEKTKLKDSYYDIAIGNVPFGNFNIFDENYSAKIHDFFFLKAIDKVKPGGCVCFITSSGTLDKKDSSIREQIALKAEFIGAVRLPRNTFKSEANTETVTDIIFLKKRSEQLEKIPDELWLKTENFREINDVYVNSYYVQNPQMVCGILETDSGPYGTVLTCIESPDVNLDKVLENITGKFKPVNDYTEYDNNFTEQHEDTTSRHFSYIVEEDGRVFFKDETEMATAVDEKEDVLEHIRSLCSLRDTVYELIDIQGMYNATDDVIREKQQELKVKYDAVVSKYGIINSRANSRIFGEDESYYLLSSLEILDDDGKVSSLADIFTKRTVMPVKNVTKADSAHDALIISLKMKGQVDLQYMSELLGRDISEIIDELSGKEIFLNPQTKKYETADEYLSGNVREKLETARSMMNLNPEKYTSNVRMLEERLPEDITAEEIFVRLGSNWIEPEIIKQFVVDKFAVPHNQVFYDNNTYTVPYNDIKYDSRSGEWHIEHKTHISNTYTSQVFGNSDKNAMELLEDLLNLRQTKVYSTDSDGKRYVDSVKTEAALNKAELINQAFSEWIFATEERKSYITERYNRIFNSIVSRKYDGEHLSFAGMNPLIELNKHQKDAIARQVFGGNTLLAHCVGAGKTFTMIAAGMELKRLGLCKKPLYVVPKPLVGQWAKEFARLYPTSHVLASRDNDFTPANRRKMIARIATGNYDAIIISHTQFMKIPLSNTYLEQKISKDIKDTMEFIRTLKYDNGEKFSVKQAEKNLKALKVRYEKLTDIAQDNMITFEQLGVDHLFVDESHIYKNLPFTTKMSNIAGINGSDNKTCMDMLYKCQYLNEITGYKGITFATGTPVSNSMTELYTNMKYLQDDLLEKMGCSMFDSWAANFGKTVTASEFDVTGRGYHQKTRFASFFNLPELITAFKESADIQMPDMINLAVPENVNIQTVAIEPSSIQNDCIEDISRRADVVQGRLCDPKDDNMLKITSDGRKLALDQRLYYSDYPDNPDSKASKCVEKAYEIYKKFSDDKAAQIIFSDIGTPNNDGRFSVYDDVKSKLIAHGVPENEIAIIHDYDTAPKKEILQKMMNEGQIRFLIGSTAKCGTGLNVQTRLKALHHLDVPWRPSDIEQREGRIIRQGNMFNDIDIFRYVTKRTFDTYSWQIIEQKQKFVGQIMTSNSPVRSLEDVDQQALEYAEVKACASGNPLILEKANLEREIQKLKSSRAGHLSSIVALKRKAEALPGDIKTLKQMVENNYKDLKTADEHKFKSKEDFKIEIAGVEYTDKKAAGDAFIENARKEAFTNGKAGINIAVYRGFNVGVSFNHEVKAVVVTISGKANHRTTLSDDAVGMITKLDNAITAIADKTIPRLKEMIISKEKDLENAKAEMTKEFPNQEELDSKVLKLQSIERQLGMDFENSSTLKEDNPVKNGRLSK